MFDRIIKVGMIKQVLCEEVVSPLPACFMGMGIYTWPRGTRPPPSIIKSKPVDDVQRKLQLGM